jgi:hypothetical protein
MVENIWNFEVLGLFLWIFLWLGTLLELFFKNQGSNYQIMNYRLMLEKPRGFFAKLAVDHIRPRSTVDRPWTAAPSSSELNLQPLRCARVPAKGRKRERGVRETRFGPHQGQAAVRRPGDGGEGSGRESSRARSLGAQNWGKEERGRSGGRRGYWGTLL